MKKQMLRLSIFFLIITFFMSAIGCLTQSRVVDAGQDDGTADLTAIDLSAAIACVYDNSYVFYPNAFYFPEDFAGEDAPEGGFTWEYTDEERLSTQYGTYRTVLKLPAGETYGISIAAADYSQRLFIDGVEQESVGWPGTTKAETTPASGFYTYYFTPRESDVEIVLQYANFNHKEGGGPHPLYISQHRNITRRNQGSLLRDCIITGCMLTVFIFYIGMYLFFGRKPYFIHFALCCLSIGIRTMLTGDKPLYVLLPDLNWYVAMALEYLALILMVFSLVSFLDSMFGDLMHRYVKRFLYALSITYALMVVLTEPLIYSRFLLTYQVLAECVGLYWIYRMLRNIRKSKTAHVMIYLGAAVFILGTIVEVYAHGRQSAYGIVGTTELGMMVFIFANMMGIAMQFSGAEAELAAARQNERELAQTNEMLDRLSRVRTDFLANITHEMRTPLAVMSSLAELTQWQLREDAVTGETDENLSDISKEAIRLAELADRLLDVTVENENLMMPEPTDLAPLLERAAQLSEPIMQKNSNRLVTRIPANLPPALVNGASILQVLLNLLTNANRHTDSGTVTVSAMEEDGMVKISVSDNGDGIDAELLPRVFVRHVSGDNGTGLGLAICKEAVEGHGGEIGMESETGKGTTVWFTLPEYKEEEK